MIEVTDGGKHSSLLRSGTKKLNGRGSTSGRKEHRI
jgi:hypothetical protein